MDTELRGRMRHTAHRRHRRDAPPRRVLVPRMPESPPDDLPGLDSYRDWRPESQARALELLREREQNPWRPFYCPIAACDGHPHGDWAWEHARADQRPPKWSDPWLALWMSGGRGS